MNDTTPPPMPAASATPPPMPAASATPPPMPAAAVPPPMPAAAPAVPPPMPPAFPPAAARIPNKFRLLILCGCAAVVLLVVIVIVSCAMSRSPAEQCVDVSCAMSRSPAEQCVDAANEARAAILEGRAGDLYEMLPPSWQKDLDDNLRLLATKIDENTFEQVTKLAGELADLAEEKEDLLVAWLAAGAEPTTLAREFNSGAFAGREGVRDLIGALRAISNWEYADVQQGRVKRIFGDRRLAAFVGRLLQANLAEQEASASEFSLVDPNQKGPVTLRVTTTEKVWDGYDEETYKTRYRKETKTNTLEWVLFEDCWVPRDFLFPERRRDGWSGAMDDLREGIWDIRPRDVRELNEGISMFRSVLPFLRGCRTPEDIRQTLWRMD